MKGYIFLKTLIKKPEEKAFIRRFGMFNILLNDGIFVSFTKKGLVTLPHHITG